MEHTYFLKISGKANIPEPLEISSGYKVILDGEVVSETKQNKEHNGEFDVVYLFKPALASIENEYGHVQKAKDLRSYSSILRRSIYRMFEADPSALDSEATYEKTMQYILANLGDIYDRANR